MANPRDFTLTGHAIDRLYERSPVFVMTISTVPNGAYKKKATYEFMYEAKEEKRFRNNLRFMTMLGEKYGFENNFTLFVRDDSVFVGISNDRGNFIVTVLKKSEHYVSHISGSVKKFVNKPKAPRFEQELPVIRKSRGTSRHIHRHS